MRGTVTVTAAAGDVGGGGSGNGGGIPGPRILGLRGSTLAVQKPNDRLLLVGEPGRRLRGGRSVSVGERFEHRAGLVGLEHRRVDVVLPAHRAGVVEPLGDLVDGFQDRGLGVPRRLPRRRAPSGARPPESSPPRCGSPSRVKSWPRDLPQVLVHVARVDRLPGPLGVHVLEERSLRGRPGTGATIRASRRSVSATSWIFPLLPRN